MLVRIATRVAPAAVRRAGATLTRCDCGVFETTVLPVADDPWRVENEIAAGELACPGCGGQLGPWGWARTRELRDRRSRRLRPRRSRCRACGSTHVLVPTCGLLRRRDAIVDGRGTVLEVVGEPGMGKTRLLDEVEVFYGGRNVSRHACQALDRGRPYVAAQPVLRALLGCTDARGLRRGHTPGAVIWCTQAEWPGSHGRRAPTVESPWEHAPLATRSVATV